MDEQIESRPDVRFGYQPIIQTKRFDIFHTHITRNPLLGAGRDVYTAWYRNDDVPRPVCVVTLFASYVEWIEVTQILRREGIATEVLEGLELKYGLLNYESASEEGEAFCESYGRDH